MACLLPVKRLKSVDLPTFGLPTIATIFPIKAANVGYFYCFG
jgi:hypothetical protein